MSYRGLFNGVAGRGYGGYIPRANHDIRIFGGIIDTIENVIEGGKHFVEGEMVWTPNGFVHRDGRPAGDHDHHDHRDSRRYRDDPRRDWRDDMASGRGRRDEPVRGGRRDEPQAGGRDWRQDMAPGRRGGEAPEQPRAIDTSNREYYRRYMSDRAIDAVGSLPREGTVDAFNRLDIELKREITQGITRQNADRGTGGPVTLDANGNLDMASVARSLGQPVPPASAPVASAPAVSAIRTLTPEEVDAAARAPLATATPPVDRATALGQAIGIDQIAAQNQAGATPTITVTAPARPTFDVRTLTTDTTLTTAELNRMSGAGISMTQTKLGQSPDAPKLMKDAEGKIVGGYSVLTEGTAAKDPTYKFVTREELETKFSKEMVAGMEQGLRPSGTDVAASNRPPEAAAPAADTGTRTNLTLNMTTSPGSLNA